MIDPLDGLLRDLIQSRIPGFTGQTQIGFVAPNADWKAALVAAGEERLNFYLYDMRENVRLRSNELQTTVTGGLSHVNAPSPRLDCTYLVTAWSPVAFTPLFDPAREEHDILYQVLEVLMRFRPLVASEVYSMLIPSGMTLGAFTAAAPALVDQPLPVSVSLPDAVREPTEFWTTMKVDSRPALHLTVTIPVVLRVDDDDYPVVTTLTGSYGASAQSVDVLVSVGGIVRKKGTLDPVPRAAVRLRYLEPAPPRGPVRRATTDANGRFTFSGLSNGRYDVTVIAGTATASDTIVVPAESGEYVIQLP